VLAPERALAIVAQIAGALDAAHRQGLVHRDVKPANVLLDEDEHAYLTDFGITKQHGDITSDPGHGTLDYLAPEQIRGEPVDGRTDGYALACVLYECLAGRPPHRRQTPAETMWAHLREEPPPLERHPALDPVLRRGLALERDDRYPTCAALIDAAREVWRRERRTGRSSSPASPSSRSRWSAPCSRRRRPTSAVPPRPPKPLRATGSPRSPPAPTRSAMSSRLQVRRATSPWATVRSGCSAVTRARSRASTRRRRRSSGGSTARTRRRISPPARALCGSGPARVRAATGPTPCTGSIP
jgi:serine/threonine protein kinase